MVNQIEALGALGLVTGGAVHFVATDELRIVVGITGIESFIATLDRALS
jgi:hypothetical protein